MDSRKKQFSVNDLISKNEKKNKNKNSIKIKFLENLKNKIETYNNYGHETILYEVPHFIIGLPPYDCKEIMNHLLDFLKEAGFFYIKIPNTLNIYISWKKSDVEKLQKQNNGFLSIALNNNGFFDNLPINSKNI
jgi:hypothetical protein